jgi:hypothetical protein
LPPFANDRLEIDIRVPACPKTGIELSGRFAPRRAFFIGFERALDDVRDRAVLPTRKTMSKVSCLGTPD